MGSGVIRLTVTLGVFTGCMWASLASINFPFYIPLILAFIVLVHIGIECKIESRKHREEVK